jgi:hypothetical protein
MEIRCPQCDAVIKTGIEHKFVTCPYCNTNLYFEKGSVLTRESIKPSIDVPVAERLLYNATGEELKVKFEYFPFYRIQKDDKTLFIPGKKVNLVRIEDYIPQGDRVTLETKVPPPDFTVEEILETIEGQEKRKSVGLLYVPFFKAESNSVIYYVDAVKGKVLSNKIIERKKHSKNYYPFALLSFGVISLIALFFPTLPFKIISVATVTFLLWYYDRGKQNG